MKIGINGRALPESFADYEHLKQTPGLLRHKTCVRCKSHFSPSNVFTYLGWRETQISGWCEGCYDKVFSPEDQGE